MLVKICNNPNCEHGRKFQPITNFFKNKHNKNGYDGYCKDCVKKRHQKYREENIEVCRKKVLASYYKKHDEYKNKHLNYYYSVEKNKKSNWLYELAVYERWFKIFEPFKGENFEQDLENSKLVLFSCQYCGQKFNPTNAQLLYRIHAIRGSDKTRFRNNFIYCSDACKHACPSFGKVSDIFDMIVNGSSREVTSEFRKLVLEKDNWTCQLCFQSKKNIPSLELHVHHEKGYKQNPIFRQDIDNCFTVCKSCHMWIHQKDGCKFSDLKCKNN